LFYTRFRIKTAEELNVVIMRHRVSQKTENTGLVYLT